jgi:hypothetical protein
MRDELSIRAQEGLSQWLAAQQWDYWFTSTSATKLRYPRQAIRLVLDSVPVASAGFVGAERHYLGGWHSHGLLALERPTQQSEIERLGRYVEICLSRKGFCRIEPAHSASAVSAYVAKYVTKDLDSDWELWNRRNPDGKTFWKSLDS